MNENTEQRTIAEELKQRADGREITSPTLLTLIEENPELLPDRQSACQVCKAALWFIEHIKENKELKVFCPKMNSIIYETGTPITIPFCDGMIQAEEEALAALEALAE